MMSYRDVEGVSAGFIASRDAAGLDELATSREWVGLADDPSLGEGV
jgi:hypothetical protein